MEKEATPKIITEEAEARTHFQELRAAGFEIYAVNNALTEEEFVALALIGGVKVLVRPANDMGGTGSNEEEHEIKAMIESEAKDAFEQIGVMGKAIFLPRKRMTEDEFVQLAAARGRVDLRRLRSSGGVFVSYGSEIGFSRLASRTIVLPKSSDYVM